jgi:RHH-type proline utilization regulon transcriptional repressor/proline dehydrogenase/delta 1-pyrroline-5-carboxylate dehydrogenase
MSTVQTKAITALPSVEPVGSPAAEQAVLGTGRRIAAAYPLKLRHPWRSAADAGTERLGRRPALRAALFRLVDVAPACADRHDLAVHLQGLLDADPSTASLAAALRRLIGGRHSASIVGAVSELAVRGMARRFIVGEDVDAAASRLRGLWQIGAATSVDLLGEATVTPSEAQAYTDRCNDALRRLTHQVGRWPARPLLERDSTGTLPRVNLSVKVTAMTSVIREDDPRRGVRDAAGRLRSVLRTARDRGAHVHVDMESMASRDLITTLAQELLLEPEFRDGPSVGMVQQAYLVDAEERLAQLLQWNRSADRAVPLTIRLVKGAYWDHESVEAAQMGWVPPVHLVKAETDRTYERMTTTILRARPDVRLAVASHNIRSLAHAIEVNRALAGDDADVEFQVLRGLGDDLQDALVTLGHRVRTYCPVGDTVAGMAYLVRRLLENTAHDSFLADRARGTEIDDLLRRP